MIKMMLIIGSIILVLRIYHLSDIAKSTLHVLFNSMLTVTRRSRYYYTLRISHETTETQRSQVTFPGSHSRFIVKWEILPYSFEKVSESSVSPQTAAS